MKHIHRFHAFIVGSVYGAHVGERAPVSAAVSAVVRAQVAPASEGAEFEHSLQQYQPWL